MVQEQSANRQPLPDASHDQLMPASLEAIGGEVRGRMDGRSHRVPRELPEEGQGIGF